MIETKINQAWYYLCCLGFVFSDDSVIACFGFLLAHVTIESFFIAVFSLISFGV